MKSISLLIKPSSNLCNLNCNYCFYQDVVKHKRIITNKFMSVSTMKEIISQIHKNQKYLSEVNIVFQGGEPTLIGKDFYESFISSMKSKELNNLKINYSIQTNGILIDEKWCEFFAENNFLVGLSWDCLEDIHNLYRTDHNGLPTYDKIKHTKKLFDSYNVNYNVISVLTNDLASRAKEVYDFIKNEDIKFIQFIPCINGLGNNPVTSPALTPKNFSKFYNELFQMWSRALDPNDYISIGFFDNLISYLDKGIVSFCGIDGNCHFQYVIEANGDVYPCDFYAVDQYLCGNINNLDLLDFPFTKNANKFISDRSSISNFCIDCKYFNYCKGGCKRLKYNMYLNETETYCGFKDFLEKHEKQLLEISSRFK